MHGTYFCNVTAVISELVDYTLMCLLILQNSATSAAQPKLGTSAAAKAAEPRQQRSQLVAGVTILGSPKLQVGRLTMLCTPTVCNVLSCTR